MGLKIVPLEGDQTFQDLALSVFHATTHTFGATTCVKIIENHEGKAFVKLQQAIQVPMMVAPQGPQPTVPMPPQP
jgi:hypothetical protein